MITSTPKVQEEARDSAVSESRKEKCQAGTLLALKTERRDQGHSTRTAAQQSKVQFTPGAPSAPSNADTLIPAW